MSQKKVTCLKKNSQNSFENQYFRTVEQPKEPFKNIDF